jgi:hypothetical protein
MNFTGQKWAEGQCLVCGSRTVDRCHIKVKRRHDPVYDEPWNIMLLCREHHTQQHKIGLITFVREHRAVWRELQAKGWEMDEVGAGELAKLVLRHDRELKWDVPPPKKRRLIWTPED